MLEPVAAVVAVNTYVPTVCVASVRTCMRAYVSPMGPQCVGIHVRTDGRDTQVRRIVDTYVRTWAESTCAETTHGGDDVVVEERKLLLAYRMRITRLHEIAPRKIALE